jgi:hypothetical protein
MYTVIRTYPDMSYALNVMSIYQSDKYHKDDNWIIVRISLCALEGLKIYIMYDEVTHSSL